MLEEAYDALLVGPGRAAPPHRATRRPPAARGAGRGGRRPAATSPPTRSCTAWRPPPARSPGAATTRGSGSTRRSADRSGWRSRRDKAIGDGLVLRDGEVHLTADADPAPDPSLVLRAAAAAAAGDTRIHRSSLDRLAAGASAIPEPWPAEVRAALVDLLAGRPPRHPGRRGPRPDGPVDATCCPSGRPSAASRSGTRTTASPSIDT